MKRKSNRRKLASVIGTFKVTAVKTADGRFLLDETDMTIVLFLSECDLHT